MTWHEREGPDIETAVADTRLGTIESLGMPPSGSEIYRLDPETGDLVFLLFDYRAWVDAGVSTCAPILI